jgi:hypothetical protein
MESHHVFKNISLNNHRNISKDKLILGILSFIVLLIYFISGVNTLNINPETGAYKDLVVAISDTALNEDASMEEKQKMLTDIEVLYLFLFLLYKNKFFSHIS